MKLFSLDFEKAECLAHTFTDHGTPDNIQEPSGHLLSGKRGRKKRKLTGTGHKLSEGLLCKGTSRNLLKGLGH